MHSQCMAGPCAKLLAGTWFVSWYLLSYAQPQSRSSPSLPGPQVVQKAMVINEIFGGSGATAKLLYSDNAVNPAAAWVELHNTGPQNVNMTGWTVRTDKADVVLDTPVVVPGGGYLILVAQGQDPVSNVDLQALKQAMPAAAGADSNTALAIRLPLSLSKRPSELAQLSLVAPDGTLVDSLGSLPAQQDGISWGFPFPTSTTRNSSRTFLATPTPGQPNSPPAKMGPFIIAMSENSAQPTSPNQPLTVNVTVAPNQAAIRQVVVVYKINQDSEHTIPATALGTADASTTQAATPGLAVFTATIPNTAYQPGNMVRWAAQATDVAGLTSRFPAAVSTTTGAGSSSKEQQQRRALWAGGTVIGGVVDPDMGPNSSVPILEWFTPFANQSLTSTGAPGSTFFFLGRMYDGAYVQRRGVTSLLWAKPKLKIRLADKDTFIYDPKQPGLRSVSLNSFWYELGERSDMKEALGLRVLRDARVPTPNHLYVHVRQNGKFFGLYSIVEEIDKTFLKRNNIPVGGPLFKSNNGNMSNLRWDVFPPAMPGFDLFGLSYPRDADQPAVAASRNDTPVYSQSLEWMSLFNFTLGLGGGGVVKRSAYIMEALDLPQVINMLAAQVVINNQDRCTKNWYLYLNPVTNRWLMLPWDLDGALGQDNGYGGAPGPQYCVLACEQWNSPLYCDSEHPQDMLTGYTADLGTAALYAGLTTASATSSVPANPMTPTAPPSPTSMQPLITASSTVARGRRQLKQIIPLSLSLAPVSPNGNVTAALEIVPGNASTLTIIPNRYPFPKGWSNPDQDLTATASPTGPAGTYNHLINAITDVPATRAMLMRRIRTLTETYLSPSGRLVQFATETYRGIRSLAFRDTVQWASGIDIDKGYLQIEAEYIPTRSWQLLQLYGPNGSYPLIPGPQHNTSVAQLKLQATYDTDTSTGAAYVSKVQVSNPFNETLDLSNAVLQDANGFTLFAFQPGTVLPAKLSLYVVLDVLAATQRSTGQGLFIVGPLIVNHAPANGTTTSASSQGSLRIVPLPM